MRARPGRGEDEYEGDDWDGDGYGRQQDYGRKRGRRESPTAHGALAQAQVPLCCCADAVIAYRVNGTLRCASHAACKKVAHLYQRIRCCRDTQYYQLV